MKRILVAIFLLASCYSFGQTPPGYTGIGARYKWIAGGFDSTLVVPRYNGAPSGLRSLWNTDGQVALDTVNSRFYIYSGGVWNRVANYSEIGGMDTAYSRNDSLLYKKNGVEYFVKRVQPYGTIAGLLSAGTNVTVTGSGTTGSPYVISSSGGGGDSVVMPLPHINFLPVDTTPVRITTTTFDGFPVLGQFPRSGDWIEVYRTGTNHNYDGFSKIVHRKSTDNGKTWSDTTVILHEDDVDSRNLGGGVTPTGRIIIFYVRSLGGTSYGGQYYIYSDDEGLTWSTPVSVSNMSMDEYSPYGKLVSGANGILLLSFYGWTGSTYKSYVIRSSDNGTTWDAPIAIYSGIDWQVTETCLEHLGGGYIIALARNEDSVGFHQFMSTDNGLTWTAQGIPLFDAWSSSHPASPFLTTFIDPYDGRRMVACWYGERQELYLRVCLGAAEDLIKNGRDGWDSRTRSNIDTMHSWDAGYPFVVHPNDNPFALVASYDTGQLKFNIWPGKNVHYTTPKFNLGIAAVKRVKSVESLPTFTINCDSFDLAAIEYLGHNLTVSAPTGTPTNGQELIYRIAGSGTPTTITWDSIFRAGAFTLPGASIAYDQFYVRFTYNAYDSKWDVTNITTAGTSGGYTNLTQFVGQNNWKTFYSNGSGDVTELTIGSSGKVLTSNGTTSAPSWETPSGGSGGSGWGLAGDSIATTDFLGSTNLRSLRFRTNNVQRAILDSTGRFGINIDIPTSALHVKSLSNGYTGGTIFEAAGTDDQIGLLATAGGLYLGQKESGGSFVDLGLFKKTGSVLYANTGNTLRVEGVSNQYTQKIFGYNNSGTSYGLHIQAGNTSTDESLYITNIGGTEKFIIKGNGNVITYGPLKPNNDAGTSGYILESQAGSVNSWKVYVESTFTPTLTNTTNIAASTAYTTHYNQIGNKIEFWGDASVDATAALTITEMGMSLPVTSALANTYDLSGVATFEDGTSVQIKADVTNGRAVWRWTPLTATNNRYSFRITYKYTAP